jgi:hypothetical protein
MSAALKLSAETASIGSRIEGAQSNRSGERMKLIQIGRALSLCLAMLVPAAQATTIPLASALAGLNPGDTYQFVFVTSGKTGNSSNLAGYNTFAQNAANAAGIGSSVGVTWSAVLSTGSGTSRAFANAPVAATSKVFLLDGSMVADGGSHPFYSATELQDHLHAINVTEILTTLTSGFVWSGGNSSGGESGSGLVGGSSPVLGSIMGTLACRCSSPGDGGWARWGNGASTGTNSIYAVSSVFTAPSGAPEPSTLLMTGSVLAGLALVRRRRQMS